MLEVAVRVPSQAEDAERAEKLKKQRLENPFHQFVEGNLIIKQGFVDKRKVCGKCIESESIVLYSI